MESKCIEDAGTDADGRVIHMDQMASISTKYDVATEEDQKTAQFSPVQEDVLMELSHLLLQLYDDSDHHLTPVNFRNKIAKAVFNLQNMKVLPTIISKFLFPVVIGQWSLDEWSAMPRRCCQILSDAQMELCMKLIVPL